MIKNTAVQLTYDSQQKVSGRKQWKTSIHAVATHGWRKTDKSKMEKSVDKIEHT